MTTPTDRTGFAANRQELAVPKHIAPEHRHAYLGGVWCRRNGYDVTDNPYESAAYCHGG